MPAACGCLRAGSLLYSTSYDLTANARTKLLPLRPPHVPLPQQQRACSFQNSASGRLSRLIFEGCGGIFSAGGGGGGGGGRGGAAGAAVLDLAGVVDVAGLTAKAQDAEWYVGRAYALLQEVRTHPFFFFFFVGYCIFFGGDVVSCMILCSGARLRGFCVRFCQFRSS